MLKHLPSGYKTSHIFFQFCVTVFIYIWEVSSIHGLRSPDVNRIPLVSMNSTLGLNFETPKNVTPQVYCPNITETTTQKNVRLTISTPFLVISQSKFGLQDPKILIGLPNNVRFFMILIEMSKKNQTSVNFLEKVSTKKQSKRTYPLNSSKRNIS